MAFVVKSTIVLVILTEAVAQIPHVDWWQLHLLEIFVPILLQ